MNVLSLATIRTEDCVGCNRCVPACPVEAIVGIPERLHTVIPQLCIGCKLCLAPCPVDCIKITPTPISINYKKQLKALSRSNYQNKKARAQLNKPLALPQTHSTKQAHTQIKHYIQAALKREGRRDESKRCLPLI